MLGSPARRLITHLVAAAVASGTFAPAGRAAGPPVVVVSEGQVDAKVQRRVRDIVVTRRVVKDELALPSADAVPPEKLAAERRIAGIRLALERAKQHESAAAWDDCVREAAGVASDAIELVAMTGELSLLRDLHLQMGACMSLSPNPGNARPQFLEAALLDEAAPPPGLHREEAEKAEAEARAEVLARSRGKVRVETEPPGAVVWIDGKQAPGVTPLEIDVRLGDHFVTLRRFRYEPHTDRRVLVPSGRVRVTLEPARRATLGEQLAASGASGAARPPEPELRLARALWSRAEQLVLVGKSPGSTAAARITLVDATTGRSLRSATIARIEDDALVRKGVCEALGEVCEPPARGIPWYVWPLAGAVVVGGAITTGFIVDAERDVRFCPQSGCR